MDLQIWNRKKKDAVNLGNQIMSVDDAQKLVLSKIKPDSDINPLDDSIDEPSSRADT